MVSPIVIAVVTALLGGGFVTAATGIYIARKKTPVERDSIIVTGAETAVLALEKTLAAETRRADRAESKLAEREGQLEALKNRFDALQRALTEAQAELRLLTHRTDA